jgi:hypothetical protein
MRGCIANCEVMKEEILVILILQHGSTIMLKYSVVTWKWVKVKTQIQSLIVMQFN